MTNAIGACLEQKQTGGHVNLRHIANEYGIPPSTLDRHVNGKVAGSCHASGRPIYSFQYRRR